MAMTLARSRRRSHARGHARDGQALFALVSAAGSLDGGRRRARAGLSLLASVTLVFLLGWILIISGVVQGIGLIGASDVPHYWLQLDLGGARHLIGVLLSASRRAGF